MGSTHRILLQTTIPAQPDDWHVGRFSLLAAHLGGLPGVEVTARDLERGRGGADEVLASLADSRFDQLWLFAVDVGEGLSPPECAGIDAFQRRGGGLLAARDHQDLGCSLLGLSGVGSAHHFHTRNPDPREEHRQVDDTETRTIVWPNYHSGRNGDVQPVHVAVPGHPLLRNPEAPSGTVEWLPAHPHEGSVDAGTDPRARVIATGQSSLTGRAFNLIVAGEGERGRWIAESSFHHFADYNWEPSRGAPSFVTEPVGDQLAREPQLLQHVRAYTSNVVRWLSGAA
jgi:hypothetical protein